MGKYFKGFSFWIVIILLIFMGITILNPGAAQPVKYDYVQFIEALSDSKIATVEIDGTVTRGETLDGSNYTMEIPPVMADKLEENIQDAIDSGKVGRVEAIPPSGTSFLIELLPTLILIVIIIAFWFVFMNNSQGGGNKVMSFGKSKAKLAKDDKKKIKFDDVAGLKEEKEEMAEVVDFLKNPRKYLALGARIPKGILMVGPPGTGKTYISRAVAGEADVPFYTISGSDFVEMFVGVGASRVRDLFDTAKKNSPCVVFIDEIDAVGRKRGAGLGGGHDEREQTLNQLLVEMDGFGDNQGIIIIAATNRPDILDPALLRPGRFDRQVLVGAPDVREREEILKVHSKNKPIADDVDLKVLAKSTPGFTPADIENVLNEAALLSARVNDKKIRMETIKRAITKVVAGVEKKSRIVSEKERKLTAYHEAGHAILAHILPDTDPVHQVTIIPRGRAGGFTMQLPDEDRSYNTKNQMERELVVLLGGRVAEKLVLKDVSTGAQNDLSRVSKVARAMVTKYAMSENLGAMSYDTEEEVFLGRDFASSKKYSEHVSAEIDREVRRIVDNAFDEAYRLLEENIDKLHVIAESLLEFETLNGEEFELAFKDGLEVLKSHVEGNKKKLAEEIKKAKEQEEIERQAFEAIQKAVFDEEKEKENGDGVRQPQAPKEDSKEETKA